MIKITSIKKIFLLTFILGLLLSCSKTKENSLSDEKDRILKLHNSQKDYHFNKDSIAFANQLSDNFISVNKGKISFPKKEETISRYYSYFSSVDFVKWDAISIGDWVETLNDAIAIVNLTGKSVDCIKSPDNCDLILRSRVDSTKIIGEALSKIENPPKIWIQMATAHIYGDPPSQLCTESSSTGYGLAPFVGKAWEKAFLESIPDNVRGVRLRTSFVIGKNGELLKSYVGAREWNTTRQITELINYTNDEIK